MVFRKELMGKDVEWKNYFGENYRYADIINGIGCGGAQLVRAEDLQEVDATSGKKSRDMIRKTAFGMNFVLVGIENQEVVDYGFPFRNMYYDLLQYQSQMKEIRKEVKESQEKLTDGEYLYGFRRSDRLHPIVTFVLCSGKEPWDGPKSLHDMLDFSEIPDKLRSMIADYQVNIIDIRRLEDTSMFATDVRCVFDFIRYADNRGKLLELVQENPYYRQMDEDAYDIVSRYTNSKELIAIKDEQVIGGKADMCQAIKELMEESRIQGVEQGIEQGIEQGSLETKITNAKNLLDVLADEVIAEKIGLPLQKVQELRAETEG